MTASPTARDLLRMTGDRPSGRWMHVDMMWGMPGMMLAGALFWLAFLVALGFAVWWVVRRVRPRDRALDVLRERYARGEISREEFEARRRDLAA